MQTTQKINVLNVKRNLDKMYSGATRVVFDILNTLEGDKFNNNLFSLNIDKKYANKNHLNFKICRKKLFGNSFSKRVHFDNKASDFINKGNFDLVIGHGDNLYQDILYLHNCVHLAHELIHNEPLPEDNQLNLFHTKLLNSRNFKRIIANSNLMKSDLIARFNISEDIIDVIYPSFNPNTFYVQNATSIKNNKNILGIKENEIVIGFVTSGDFQKRGLDNFIKIIEDLPDSIIKNVKILIVGKGDLPEIKK
ncbi:glycosyltransferase [Celerinatantimonas sp. MCCC 1A17872]|uniref:glycosyltransferase n=1 Tax=Celerinatantimonas sp. MCCC 1A17872 TaxID=3177514 RepID=UPI0038C08509